MKRFLLDFGVLSLSFVVVCLWSLLFVPIAALSFLDGVLFFGILRRDDGHRLLVDWWMDVIERYMDWCLSLDY